MKRHIFASIIIMCLFFCVLGIISHDAEAKKSKVRLNYRKYTMKPGKTLKLRVKGTKKKVTWSSNRKKVAVVSKKGMVKAVKTGKATITAKVGRNKYRCKIVVAEKKNNTSKTAGVSASRSPWTSSNDSKDADEIYQYDLEKNIEIIRQTLPDGSILIGMTNHVPYTIPRVEFMLEYTTYGDRYEYKNLNFCHMKPEETCYYALKGRSSDTEQDDQVNPDTVQITVTRAYYKYEYVQDVKDTLQLSVDTAEADELGSRPEGTLRYQLTNLGEKAITQYEFVIGFYDQSGTLMKVEGRWNCDESNRYFTPDIRVGSYIEPPYDEERGIYLTYASYRILYQNATYQPLLLHGN